MMTVNLQDSDQEGRVVFIRCSPELKAIIKRAAKANKLSINKFVLQATLAKIDPDSVPASYAVHNVISGKRPVENTSA